MGKRSREKRERRERGEISPKRERPESGILTRSFLVNIIHWGTYLALFTPLILSAKFFFPFVGPKSLYFMGLVEIIFFVWLILVIYYPQYRPRKNPILIALTLFLIVLIFSSLFGQNLSYSFWSKPERMTGLLMWFHLLAFFLVISSVFQKSDWQKIFALSLFVGVILSFINFFSDNPSMRGGATLGNDSFLGTYLLFSLFFALYLFFSAEKELKIYSIICFLIIFLGLFLSGARAAKLSFLGGLILLFFLWLIFPQKRSLRWLGLVLLTLFIIFVFSFVFLAFQPDSFVRKKIIEKTIGPTFGGRFVVWQGAWQGFLEKPLLGWGPENFELSFFKHYDPCLGTPRCGGDIWYDRAHNIIFDTLVSVGLLGMITYLGIFLSVIYLLWERYFQQKIEFWVAGIFTVLLVSYSVQNLTVFDMVSSYLMFFLVLGFVESITTPYRETIPIETRGGLIKKISLIIILILFIFSFFYFVIQPLKTDYYVIAALRSAPASEQRLNYYKKSLAASPLGKYQIREFFAQLTLEFSQSEKVREFSAENFKKEIDFVVEELEKSRTESPLDFRSQLKLGQLYNVYAVLLDQIKILEAERVLEKAIEVSPTNQQGYWALAQTKLYQGKFKEALSLAERAIELEPELLRSHQIVIQIAKIIGDNELAKRKFNEAIEINPEWQEELKRILEG